MAKSNAATKVRDIAEASVHHDPVSSKRALIKELGEFKFETFHNQILCAGYITPGKTAGGIILTDRAREEDIYQGSIGLVIGIGPGAFKDDKIAQFHGVKVEMHQWVLYRPSDGLGLYINGVPCRLFQDVNILGRLEQPEQFWS